jgi:hypothetical protein
LRRRRFWQFSAAATLSPAGRLRASNRKAVLRTAIVEALTAPQREPPLSLLNISQIPTNGEFSAKKEEKFSKRIQEITIAGSAHSGAWQF